MGGMLAVAQSGHARATIADAPWPAGRWMVAFLAITLGGIIAVLFRSSPTLPAPDPTQEAFRGVWMLSPVSAVYELTRDRTWTGTSAAVVREHWIALAATAAAAVPLWLLALLRTHGLRRTEGLH